jgi:2-keto-4-pentenoate hydratase
MLENQVEEAARLLSAARSGQPLVELPAGCRPQSEADAYQIQDAVARRLGEANGGWKVGAASGAVLISDRVS